MPTNSGDPGALLSMTFPDQESARSFLRSFLLDSHSRLSLRRTLLDECGLLDVSRLSDEEIVRLVAGRMVSGHLRLGMVPRGRAGVGQAEPVEEEAPPLEAAAAAIVATDPHWFELVFEDAAGNPLPGVEYVFHGTDRTKEEGRTGDDGKVRRDDIPEGTCTVEVKEVTGVRWLAAEGKPDDEIGFRVETSGFAAGSSAKIEVFEMYRETSGDVVATVDGSLAEGGAFEGGFRYAAHADSHRPSGRKYAEFILKATVGASWRKSGALKIELKNLLDARWSAEAARTGEVVELIADAPGYANGTTAEFSLFERDWVGEDDPVDAAIECDGVKDGQVRGTWTYEYIEDDDDVADGAGKGYNPPEYYFVVKVGDHEARSKLLRFRDYLEVVLHDDRGNPAAGVRVYVKAPDGSRRSATTDAGGEARFEDIPPGKCEVSLDGHYASLEATG